MNPRKFDFHPRDGLFWGSLHLYALGFTLETAKVAGYLHLPSRQYLIEHLEEADKLYLAGRLLSVLAGVLTILVLYAAGLRLGGPFAGLTAAALTAFAPVHIVNSAVVRPDILMLLFASAALYFSIRHVDDGDRASWVLAALFAGLAAAAKYNGGVFLLCPWLAVRLKKGWSKELVWIPLLAAVAFFAGCPYALIDFPTFLGYLRDNAALAREGLSSELYGPGWRSYWTVFLPCALSAPVSWSALAGAGLALFSFAGKIAADPLPARRKNTLLFFSGLMIFFVTVRPHHQMVWYTLPVLPFCVLFAAQLASSVRTGLERRRLAWAGTALCAALVGWQGITAWATVGLYRGINPREAASAWIETNIPRESAVAIPRKYFWTPGVLRQYHPPYRLIEGGDDQSVLDQAVLGFESAAAQADYAVVSELETRNYLHPKLAGRYAGQAGVLNGVMGRDFRETARFSRSPEFIGFRLPLPDFPPSDWIYPGAEIRIYQKIPKDGRGRTFDFPSAK
jgi:hypothetical protein